MSLVFQDEVVAFESLFDSSYQVSYLIFFLVMVRGKKSLQSTAQDFRPVESSTRTPMAGRFSKECKNDKMTEKISIYSFFSVFWNSNKLYICICSMVNI